MSVGASELAVVPRDGARGAEAHADPLGGLALHHLGRLGGEFAAAVALEDLAPVLRDSPWLALHGHVAFEHHSAQLLVLDSVLHLERRVGIALEVLRLLRLGERPADQLLAVGHVPERDEVGPPAGADRGDAHRLLLVEEVAYLVRGHPDLVSSRGHRARSVFGMRFHARMPLTDEERTVAEAVAARRLVDGRPV